MSALSCQLRAVLSLCQNNDIQTCKILSHYQGEISQPRTQSVRFVSRGLGFDPWWSGSLRLGELNWIEILNNEIIIHIVLKFWSDLKSPVVKHGVPLGKCDHLFRSLLFSFIEKMCHNSPLKVVTITFFSRCVEGIEYRYNYNHLSLKMSFITNPYDSNDFLINNTLRDLS